MFASNTSQVSSDAVYVEDVFSTYLYTGNGGSRTINNGIALGNNLAPSLNGLPVTIVSGNFSNPYFISYINDDDIPTGNQNFAYADAGTYFDVYVDLLSPAVVTAYKISPQGTAPSAVYNTITGFRVMASNDASNWTTITTFSSISTGSANWTAGVLRTFSFSNSTAYRYWRIQGTNTTGSDGAGTSISEWQVTGTTTTAGSGGLVWIKLRDSATPNGLYDTARGTNKRLISEYTDAQDTVSDALNSFNSNGFTLGSFGNVNPSGYKLVSWTFRKQPKFFDVVTYTGNGANRTIAHNLGSTPGCIIIKCTSTASNWIVYHRGLTTPSTGYLNLNNTNTESNTAFMWNSTAPTATEFSLGTNINVNQSGQTFVAYLFAHDAGGFGTAGTDNVISCGSVTMPGAGGSATVTLGWEPQWVLMKDINHTGGAQWLLIDNMRGWPASGSTTANTELLRTYQSNAENGATYSEGITSTGFQVPSNFNYADDNTKIIYIAIRRGPMKTPTSGTSVFAPVTYSGTGGSDVTQTTGFPVDFTFNLPRNNAYEKNVFDRLRGWPNGLYTNLTIAEFNNTSYLAFDNNTGVVAKLGSGYPNVTNGSGWTYVTEAFRRAPGFMDVVCYTGTGSTRTVSHNLGVAPELMIVKTRNSADNDWAVYAASLGATKHLRLNATIAEQTGSNRWGSTSPTASVFTVGDANETNWNTYNFVAYLFATCPGVSKVGSYTGSGTTKQIDCGFTGGARFVLIKRTDSTGDWYVWDTARGIISGNDPYILLNSTAAEVTNTDYIDAYSAGFEISSTAPAAINASGGTFIYLAIS